MEVFDIAFRSDFQKSLIFSEMGKEDLKDLFGLSKDKVIYNVDSLYYTIKLEVLAINIDIPDTGLQYVQLIDYLVEKQKEADLSTEGFSRMDFPGVDVGLISKGFGFGMYKRDIQCEHFFSAFVADRIPNKTTPEIFIQLRSEYLWLHGDIKAFNDSYVIIKKFLEQFDLKIFKADINRLDLAHHTNLIQSPTKYFSTHKLGDIQISNYERWHEEGYFEGGKAKTDYITLGRRKSNNHFFRCYLKNQEICIMGYKQFFLQLWEKEKLISKYDKYCLELCFIQGNYNYLHKARLIFYLSYGLDEIKKEQVKEVLSKDDKEDIRILADVLLPPITKIMNVEFQTKRKYHSTIKFIEHLGNCYHFETKGVMQYLVNVNKLHDDLTYKVIRFIDEFDKKKFKKDKKTAFWWEKIQRVNLKKNFKNSEVLINREYQKSLDIQRIKKSVSSKIASLSVYTKHDNEDSIEEDCADFLTFMNENDLEVFSRKKKEKAYLLKGRLEGTEPISIDRNFVVIGLNLETGEIS